MRKRRIILAAVVLALLVGITTIVWEVNDWPPVRLILKYGFPPTSGPTGNKRVIEGVEFVELKPGYFRMGSTYLAEGGNWIGRLCATLGLPWGKQPEPSFEMPVHWVEFRRGFWIAKTEVTNAQYERFDPRHQRGSYSKGNDDPVTVVSSVEAYDYCAWLASASGHPVRLPSEAEWECACRAGSDGEFTHSDVEARLSDYAWFGHSFPSNARAVATKLPNRWGLFDLHGNVSEWCLDRWHGSYEDAPADGSAWTKGGGICLCRGGSWKDPAAHCRSAYRAPWMRPGDRYTDIGFRPAFSNPERE